MQRIKPNSRKGFTGRGSLVCKQEHERTLKVERHLLTCFHRLIAMYVFELFYRPKISPVSVGHHIGTIMIGQSAIAISLNLVRERDATIEFILCTVWGKSEWRSLVLLGNC